MAKGRSVARQHTAEQIEDKNGTSGAGKQRAAEPARARRDRGRVTQWVLTLAVPFLLLASGAAPGAAQTNEWVLTGVTFDDQTAATGTLTYDFGAESVTDWSIEVEEGANPDFTALTYTPSNSSVSTIDVGDIPEPAFLFSENGTDRALRIAPAAALDGSSSSVDVELSNSAWAVECFNCNPFRNITGGAFELADPPESGISLEKSGSGPGVFEVGGTVEYTFAVANTGDVELSEVAITDTLSGLSPISCPEDTLAPEAEMTCTATYELTQADVDAGSVENTATVTAEAADGLPAPSAESSVTVTSDEPVPALPPLALVLLTALLATATLWTLRRARA